MSQPLHPPELGTPQVHTPVWAVCILLLQLSFGCCWHLSRRDLPSGLFCLSAHLMMDTCVASAFEWLWLMLLWTCVYKYPFVSLISLFCYIPRVGIVGSYASLCLTFKEITVHFIHLLAMQKGSNFSASLPTLIFCCFDNSCPNECEVIYHNELCSFRCVHFIWHFQCLWIEDEVEGCPH